MRMPLNDADNDASFMSAYRHINTGSSYNDSNSNNNIILSSYQEENKEDNSIPAISIHGIAKKSTEMNLEEITYNQQLRYQNQDDIFCTCRFFIGI